MNQTLLQQIDTMRKEMVAMVEEQGMSIQDALVIEKSQSLDLLIAQYVQQSSYTIVGQG
ncbi:MAG: aspartyl-phosphate phosphatase Spo0E family protein [Peptococcaceae bacterium]